MYMDTCGDWRRCFIYYQHPAIDSHILYLSNFDPYVCNAHCHINYIHDTALTEVLVNLLLLHAENAHCHINYIHDTALTEVLVNLLLLHAEN